MKKRWWVLIIILMILTAIVAVFYILYFQIPIRFTSEQNIVNPAKTLSPEQAILDFNESYADYLIFLIGGQKLHNPPLSSNNPKIKIVLGEEIFISEVNKGVINTRRADLDEVDLIIRTSRQEIVNAILSSDAKLYLKQSVSSGNIQLEMVGSYPSLFSKGYLGLYKEITGEEIEGEGITGKIIRIFD